MIERTTDINSIRSFVSFDGSTSLSGKLWQPTREQLESEALNFRAPLIPRGAGLSYAAASFGKDVLSIEHQKLHKILAFNQEEKWIEVEAGMTLGELYEFLIERGLLLATQPGHPSITVGGCIAADIHGKNQYLDGTFISQVLQLSLYHPAHGVMLLSPQQDAELFRLTCGGYGLTGNIISARLKLKSVIAATAVVTFRPIAGIEELIREFNGSAGSADILFSWHDFTDFSASFGRGFIQEGRFAGTASSSPSPDKIAKQSLSAESRGNLPIKVFNRFSVRAMNILYGAKASKGESSVTLSLFDSMFPIQKSKELYFKFFGKVGFHEYQVVLPEERFAEYVDGVKQFLLKTPLPITLASAKLFSGKSDLLRFTGKGICFALNFPRQVEAQQFLPYLDQLLIKCGGIPNIIKDSRLSRAVVEACYPEYSQFRQRLHEYDPQRIYRSELSDRLGL